MLELQIMTAKTYDLLGIDAASCSALLVHDVVLECKNHDQHLAHV